MNIPAYTQALPQKTDSLSQGKVANTPESQLAQVGKSAFQEMSNNLIDRANQANSQMNQSGAGSDTIPQKAGNAPDRDQKSNLDWLMQDIPSIMNLYKSVRSTEEAKLNEARQIPKTGLDLDFIVDKMFYVVDDWNKRLPNISYSVIRALGWISRISATQLSHKTFDKVKKDGIPFLATQVETKFDNFESGLWNTTSKEELKILRTTLEKLKTARAYVSYIKYDNVASKLFFDCDLVRTHTEHSLGWIRPEMVYEKAIFDSAKELDSTMTDAESSKLARAIMKLLPKETTVIAEVENPMKSAEALSTQLTQTDTFLGEM